MKRLRALALIAILLGGLPWRADPALGTARLVVALPAAPAERQAVCDALRQAGAAVRLTPGRTIRVEVTCRGQAELAGAIAALRRAVEATGLGVDFYPEPPAAEWQALCVKPAAPDTAPRADAQPALSAAQAGPPPAPPLPAGMTRFDAPAPVAAAIAIDSITLRGPPA